VKHHRIDCDLGVDCSCPSGDLEAFFVSVREAEYGAQSPYEPAESGWYWRQGDAPPAGPFASEALALAAGALGVELFEHAHGFCSCGCEAPCAQCEAECAPASGPGWYWRTAQGPEGIPEGEPVGPFASPEAALESAGGRS
jgi:hypothetical protein